MKKRILLMTGLLSGSILFSSTALAAQNANTEGKIEYGTGSLTIDPNPVDPTDPTKPIDPETGLPEVEQPGGNMNSRLPKNLNFGYHVNQTTAKEKWIAKNVDTTGLTDFDELSAAYNSASQTVSALLVEDNRTEEGNWEVKVKQEKPFAIAATPTKNLGSTLLSITTGDLWNNISTTGISVPNSIVNIAPTNQEVSLLTASAGNGAGMTKLKLDKFELEIPANTVKETALYTADINWVVSETP